MRRQTGLLVCRLALVVSADVYDVGSEAEEEKRRPRDGTGEEAHPRRTKKQGAVSTGRQDAAEAVMDQYDSSQGRPELRSLFPSAGRAGTWIQLRGSRLDKIEDLWLVGSDKQWRVLKARRLSEDVILVRIPTGTNGGAIGYSIGERLYQTGLRYAVVGGATSERLRKRMKPKTLTRQKASAVLERALPSLRKCRSAGAASKKKHVRITVSGETGQVSAVDIQGDADSTVDEACVKRLIKDVIFPVFEVASVSIMVPLEF